VGRGLGNAFIMIINVPPTPTGADIYRNDMVLFNRVSFSWFGSSSSEMGKQA
jgi:hypothetical protein